MGAFMTLFVSGPGGDGNQLDGFTSLLALTVLSHSATKIVLDTGPENVHITLKGTGFANFDGNGFPTTGTITSIIGTETSLGFYPGSNDVAITKFSMSVEDVL